MTKRMLIDALHPEEMRVVIADERQIFDFDFVTAAKKQVKGNIYLAKITRVEPSLQAAFVEYGGGKQGFLPFAEIHPDYYQIPVSDRRRLLEEAASEEESTEPQSEQNASEQTGTGEMADENMDAAQEIELPAASLPFAEILPTEQHVRVIANQQQAGIDEYVLPACHIRIDHVFIDDENMHVLGVELRGRENGVGETAKRILDFRIADEAFGAHRGRGDNG